MTEIRKSLVTDSAATTAMVAATLDFSRRHKSVTVRLEGTILSEHAAALRDFLRNLSYFRGTSWKLELKNLAVISLRGLRVLVKFAREIQRRGYQVEITSIQPAIVATFLEMGVYELFGWEMLKHQTPPAPTVRSSRRNLPKRAHENAAYAEELV
jgi:anti-anti-sigma factor